VEWRRYIRNGKKSPIFHPASPCIRRKLGGGATGSARHLAQPRVRLRNSTGGQPRYLLCGRAPWAGGADQLIGTSPTTTPVRGRPRRLTVEPASIRCALAEGHRFRGISIGLPIKRLGRRPLERIAALPSVRYRTDGVGRKSVTAMGISDSGSSGGSDPQSPKHSPSVRCSTRAE
jgi:hypothetical protein